ncbi:MAG: hypothetical protein K2W96_26050 [Gemmataceae bacterium]|nr:hypothetical protein [Gemmataceae bacterium]
MITSTVNRNLELVVTLPVHDSASVPHGIEFVIDTGCEGQSQLPASIVATFGLTFVSQRQSRLADGAVIVNPVHRAVVVWDGSPRIADVVASGGVPLLGMWLLEDFDLRARCRRGGLIEIEAAP